MKTNKYFLTVLGFFSGMAVGISIIGLFAFSSGPASPVPPAGILPITAAEAHGYFNKYMTDAVAFNQVIKGFTIDKSQLEAMNNIAKENANLAGFRIYMGKNNNSAKIGIVVGVDLAGKDALKNTIYNTESRNLSPCPPICDNSSAISNN
jgi:hypothetical protein